MLLSVNVQITTVSASRLRIRYTHFVPRIARLYIESKGTQITIRQKSPERPSEHLRSAKGHYVISLSIRSFIVVVMETDVEVHMQDVTSEVGE
jgi:hypothetical protein